MRAAPVCPRCFGPLHAPSAWSSAWRCGVHGDVPPLHTHRPSDAAFDAVRRMARVPVWVPWPLPAGWPRVLGFAGAWVLAELARGLVLTGFPWNLMGTVWAFAALPVQGAAVIGVHGLSLVTLLLAGVPLLRGRLPWVLAALALAGFVGFGAWRLSLPAPSDQPVRLVLVQGLGLGGPEPRRRRRRRPGRGCSPATRSGWPPPSRWSRATSGSRRWRT